MEPVDYLKIVKSHWKVVAVLVVLAIGAVYLVSPSDASRTYSAEHVLRLASSSGEDGSTTLDNVQLAAMHLETGEVPARAAELLGEGASAEVVEALSEKVDAIANPEVGTVTVVASDPDPNRAVDIANAFGLAWIEYVEEEEQARRSEGTPASERIVEIQNRLAAIATQLDRNPPPPNAGELRIEQLELELDNVVQQQREDLASASNTVAYETLTEARSASSDSALLDNRPTRMALAGLVAAILGFGVAMMLDRNDSRVRTKEQAEKRFRLPVLAEVPTLSLRDRGRAAVVSYEREPGVAEAYRSLRTAMLLFRAADVEADEHGTQAAANGNGQPDQGRATRDAAPQGRQVVVVTSPEPGEGKSTTAANLALAYAEAGHSALILSWDLWRPIAPSVFGAADGPGVTDYLDDPQPSLLRYVQETAIPDVSIVTVGVRGSRPSPRSDRMRQLLDEARRLADVVIVDTAPILSASVTRELATLADAVLLVARVGRTTSEAADRCAEMLDRVGAPGLGVVLVGVPTGTFADYYGPVRKAGYDRIAGPRRKPASRGAAEQPSDQVPSSGTTERAGDAGRAGEGRHLRSSSDPVTYWAPTPAGRARAAESRDRRR